MNDVAQRPQKTGLIARFGERYGVDPDKVLNTLKKTAWRQQNGEPTNEQMMALLIVADQYKLNPFTKEIYAFPDKNNGIVPIVGVDGWSRIINGHEQLDGIEFRYSEEMTRPEGADADCHVWCEVWIYRKDRSRPVVVREYLDEVYRPPFKKRDGGIVKGPWQSHPKRFLRHKTLIQGSRISFGFVGIYDEDEGERIRDVTPQPEPAAEPPRTRYTDAEFDDRLSQWRDLIQSGKKTVAQVIATVSTRVDLTDEQAERIRRCADIDAKTVEPEEPEPEEGAEGEGADDAPDPTQQFIDEMESAEAAQGEAS